MRIESPRGDGNKELFTVTQIPHVMRIESPRGDGNSMSVVDEGELIVMRIESPRGDGNKREREQKRKFPHSNEN